LKIDDIAGVYEYTEPAEGTGEQKLVINAQVPHTR
jgi:hypothetical protein